MKNVYEVLRQKELELSKLEKEVEALRVHRIERRREVRARHQDEPRHPHRQRSPHALRLPQRRKTNRAR